jgi:hypothetical protein
VKSGKSDLPDVPDWVGQIRLARYYRVLPSAIDEEPLEWVVRLVELYYQESKQGVTI